MCRTQLVLALLTLFVGLAHSWDIVITKKNFLEFYTNDNVSASYEFEDSLKLKAIVYNEVTDMVVYVDKQVNGDRICGYYIAAKGYRCFTKVNGRDIRGLAFDPATELLFFTDTNERSINWISFKPGSNNNIYGNLLIKTGDVIPTDIAVDSCRGYVYWINTNVSSSTIERARFNGSEREVYSNLDQELHSLVIDQVTQKLYVMSLANNTENSVWYTDVNLFTDFTGFMRYTSKIPSSNTLTVSKTFLYSVNWCTKNCVLNTTRYAWKSPKTKNPTEYYIKYILFSDDTPVNGIAANYNIKDNYQDLPDCEPLTKYVQNNVGSPCLYGQAICNCTQKSISNRAKNAVISNNLDFFLRLFLLVFLISFINY